MQSLVLQGRDSADRGLIKMPLSELMSDAVQILLSGGEPQHLEKLRDGIHQSVTGTARKPLAPRDPNIPRV